MNKHRVPSAEERAETGRAVMARQETVPESERVLSSSEKFAGPVGLVPEAAHGGPGDWSEQFPDAWMFKGSSANVEVSFVTATRLLPDRVGFLEHLAASVRACGVSRWEWVVVVDGPSQPTPGWLATLPNTRVVRLPANVGQAAALNFGIHHASGRFVMCPDDDDSLLDGAPGLLMRAALEHKGLWAAGPLIHQRWSGVAWVDDDVWRGAARPGRHEPGSVWRAWVSPDATLPVVHSTMLVDTELARRVGGLQGIAQGEGLGYVMGVTGSAPGVVVDTPVYRYRQHAGQVTKSGGFNDMESLVRRVAWERGRALARSPHVASVQ